MNLSELIKENVDRFGDYPLLRFGGKTVTNTELLHIVNRMASALEKMGVRPGDRVALVMGNSPELIIALFACFKIGAWAMPSFLSLKPHEFSLVLADAEPSALIAHRLFIDGIRESVEESGEIKFRITSGRGLVPDDWTGWQELMDKGADKFDSRDCEPDDVALLLYTSGTTGVPKGVMLSHMNLYSNAVNTARSQGLKQGEVNLLALPLNHSFGITALLAALATGIEVVLLPRFDPAEVFECIQKFKVESMALVPTMMAFMLGQPDQSQYDIASLNKIVAGGAPLILKLRKKFTDAFPHVQVLEAYGLTEASPGVTVTRPDQPARDSSVGQTIENQEVCVMDETGKYLGPGEVGEVCTRGPHIMVGYYKRKNDTEAVIRDGWLHTGDLGYLDDDGYLYLTGRLKDLIIRGGVNVYPVDIEHVIREHPAVSEAAVIGVPDDVYGEEPAAVVVKKPGTEASEADIIEHCEKHLAPFQVPRQVLFTRILPKSGMGKVRKKDLKDQFAGTIGSGD